MEEMTNSEVLEVMETLNATLSLSIFRNVSGKARQEEQDALTAALAQIARLNYYYNRED